MKRSYILFLSVTAMSLFAVRVFAANTSNSGSRGAGEGIGTAQGSQGMGTSQPIQNQVQTQNMGEEQQLQVQTQELQGDEVGKGVNGNSGNGLMQGEKRNLGEARSSVAQKVQELLRTGSAAGGIGDQVRQWAKVQQQSELKIQEHLTKIESKTGLARSLFGPNYGSLNSLKQEMNQNRVRVQQLEQLKLELSNEADITNVQEMIELLNQENTALQEKIEEEESNGGVFGWLVRLFAK